MQYKNEALQIADKIKPRICLLLMCVNQREIYAILNRIDTQKFTRFLNFIRNLMSEWKFIKFICGLKSINLARNLMSKIKFQIDLTPFLMFDWENLVKSNFIKFARQIGRLEYYALKSFTNLNLYQAIMCNIVATMSNT